MMMKELETMTAKRKKKRLCVRQWEGQGVGVGFKKERDNSTLQILDSLKEELNFTWPAQEQN